MRSIDPFIGPQVWAAARPALKRLLCKGAGMPESVAALPFEKLDHGQIGSLAGAAARLAWAASELEAMAPLVPEPQRRAPGAKPAAPLPTIRPELAKA